jgi:AcrR family transcriptional regulator
LKQELREEILAAARDLFVNDGYGSVSMRKIAETVGCAPGTLYLHFKDKAAILNAICVETFTKLDKRMEAIAKDKGEPLEKLRRGGRAYIQFALDHPHHYWLTFGLHGNEWSKEERTKVAGMHSFGCLQACIRDCVEAGKLRSNDVEEIAQAVWSSAHGVIMLLIAKPEFAFVEQTRLIDRVLDISIEGIRKR